MEPITVYSEPGKGTVFHLYFPAAGEAVAESEPPPKEIAAGRGERIVFVDDEVAIVALFTEILTGLGYQVTGFHLPEEALAAVRADPAGVDLVITDLSMPKLDGPALVRELRALRTDLPIIMATGFVGERDLRGGEPPRRGRAVAQAILQGRPRRRRPPRPRRAARRDALTGPLLAH